MRACTGNGFLSQPFSGLGMAHTVDKTDNGNSRPSRPPRPSDLGPVLPCTFVLIVKAYLKIPPPLLLTPSQDSSCVKLAVSEHIREIVS